MTLQSLDVKSTASEAFGLTNYGKLKGTIDDLIRASDGILSPGLYKLWDSVEAGVSYPSASITTPTLPQTFKHLKIVAYLRGDGAAGRSNSLMRFNGDTSALYDWIQYANVNGAFGPGSGFLATAMNAGQYPGGGSIANGFGVTEITIPNYATTAAWKTYTAEYWSPSAATTDYAAGGVGGMWHNTAAVATVTLAPASGNWVAGSRITVYGEA